MRTFTYICLIGATLAAKLNPCDPDTGLDEQGFECDVEQHDVEDFKSNFNIDIDEANEQAKLKCLQGHLPSCVLMKEHRYHKEEQPQPIK